MFNRLAYSRYFSSSTSQKVKTAIVMANMGGPKTVNDVHDFLLRLFSDSDIIKLPMQSVVSKLIVARRVDRIRKQYQEIGGGSPIHDWTDKQGNLMCQALDKISPATGPHKAYLGFRYVHPLTEEAINQIEKDGAERAVFFSQFFQYSCTTSGSSVNAFARHYCEPKLRGDAGIDQLTVPNSVENSSKPPVWSLIDRWPTHPKMVDAFADLILQHLDKLPDPVDRKNAVLIFSAHSLPVDIVDRGDPYVQEVSATVQAVMQKLNFCNPYRLTWQSKVGPKRWVGPATDDVLKSYGKQKRNVLLVPISFTSDHIETLYELDLEYAKEISHETGMQIIRVPALNTHPKFIEALTDIVSQHLKSGQVASNQYFLRCPGCVNEACLNSRLFIKTFQKYLDEWNRLNQLC